MKKLISLSIILLFFNCQEKFELTKEESYDLINKKLYNELFKIENKQVLLNETKLVNPELELLDFDYEKEKESLNDTIIFSDDKKTSDNISLIPPQSIESLFSNDKWEQNLLRSFKLVEEKDSIKTKNKFIFFISEPVYNYKTKMALIKTLRYRINGWSCHIDERYFIYQRKNKNWVSLNEGGTYNPYLTLFDYYKNQETK